MDTSKKSAARRCPVCSAPIEAGAPKQKRYCTEQCQRKASKRKNRGKPIANPAATASEVATLHATITELQNRNRKLEKLVARLRGLLRKRNSQWNYAETAIATARRKEEMAIATERNRQSEILTQQLRRIEELELEVATLRNRTQDYEELKEEKEAANHFAQTQSAQFKNEIRKTQQVIAQLQAAAKISAPILRDYQYFAERYFRTKPRDLWDPSDSSRLQRLNNLRNVSKGQK